MKPELREKILAYNKVAAERKEKASDLDIIISEILQLPYGQLKKVLTDEVMAVLEKYSYGEGKSTGEEEYEPVYIEDEHQYSGLLDDE